MKKIKKVVKFLSVGKALAFLLLFFSIIFSATSVSAYVAHGTLDPGCAPGAAGCTVASPLVDSFTSNFAGTGDLTTTGSFHVKNNNTYQYFGPNDEASVHFNGTNLIINPGNSASTLTVGTNQDLNYQIYFDALNRDGNITWHSDTNPGYFSFNAKIAPIGFTMTTSGGASVYTLPTTDGTTGQYLQTNGSGTVSWAAGSGTPGGSSTHVQYNNSGALAGSSNLTFDGTTLTANALTLTTALTVGNGGTGKNSLTAYAILTGGTTATGALQQVSGLGTSGQVLTSNGNGALPTWQNGSSTASPADTCYVSTNGNDSTGNGSFTNPYLTVQKAFDVVAAGNCKAINVGPGTYDETAILTVGASTPSQWSLVGAGMWSTAIRAVKVDASGGSVPAATMNVYFSQFKSSEDSTSDPAIDIVTSSSNALTGFHLDVNDLYLSRNSANPVVRVGGSISNPSEFAFRFTGTTTIRNTSSGDGVELPFGILQSAGSTIYSASGREIFTSTGARAVQLTGTLIGNTAGMGKSAPNIYATNSGTGLQILVNGVVFTVGTGHIVEVPAGAGAATVLLSETVVVRAGSGGVSNPTGAVIQGNTVDASTGAEIPVTAGLLIPYKKALSTYYTGTTSGLSATTVQAAIDEVASEYVPYTGATATLALGTHDLTTTGAMSAGSLTLTTPLAVGSGGIGVNTLTPYALMAGGTTATGAMQQISGLGTAGQVLMSNGAGALPTWQNEAAAVSPTETCYVAKNGNDSTGTGAFARPYLTVQKAFDGLAAGSCRAVVVGPGNYDELATLTVADTTPAKWTLTGVGGSWASNIRAIKIVATSAYSGGSMVAQLQNFVSDSNFGSSTDPGIEFVTSSSFTYLHIDTNDLYIHRSSDNTSGLKVSGTSPSAGFGIRAVATTIKVYGASAPAVICPYGVVKFTSSEIASLSGNEIQTTTGMSVLAITDSIIGSLDGSSKAAPPIYATSSGSGGKIMISSSLGTTGTANFIDVEAGAGTASVITFDLLLNRGGSGGISNPAGAVIQGSIVDASTGAEIPVTAGATIPLKKATSTYYSGTTSGLSATTVQAAIDEIAASTAVFSKDAYNTINSSISGNGTMTGANNFLVGNTAGHSLTSGTENNFIGTAAGYTATSGGYNVAIGTNAGYTNSTGSNNVFIGPYAGAYETGSNAFYLDNQNRTNTAGDKAKALMYGTFDATAANQTLTVNGSLTLSQLGSTSGTAVVADANGKLYKSSSSLRYKDHVAPLVDTFSKILQTQPKSFVYKDTNTYDIGYLAEDFNTMGLTNLVIYDNYGRPDAIKYDRITLYLVEIMKQQQIDIDSLKVLSGLSSTGTAGDGTVGSTTSNTLIDGLKKVLADVGIKVNGLVTSVNDLVANKVTTNVARVNGMEMVDKITKDVYCTWVENGVWLKSKGECAAVENAVAVPNTVLPIDQLNAVAEKASDAATQSQQAANSAAQASQSAQQTAQQVEQTATETQEQVEQIQQQATQQAPAQQSLNVNSISAISPINVTFGASAASISLPSTINVTLSDNSIQIMNISWNGGTPTYDGNVPGTYSFAGTLVLPDGVTNTGNVGATVDVTVPAQSIIDVVQEGTSSVINGAGNLIGGIFNIFKWAGSLLGSASNAATSFWASF